MKDLINEISPIIPEAIKISGMNPFHLLYETSSKGIHEYSENVCIEKASALILVLKLVIKKINEQKHDTKALLKAVNFLKNN